MRQDVSKRHPCCNRQQSGQAAGQQAQTQGRKRSRGEGIREKVWANGFPEDGKDGKSEQNQQNQAGQDEYPAWSAVC